MRWGHRNGTEGQRGRLPSPPDCKTYALPARLPRPSPPSSLSFMPSMAPKQPHFDIRDYSVKQLPRRKGTTTIFESRRFPESLWRPPGYADVSTPMQT